ncbi:hypothetical protein FRB99_005562 [Tulasnella sp. 403]|nr:hypothetical protein FRB99_005562 [Tulasnella sp. 403]
MLYNITVYGIPCLIVLFAFYHRSTIIQHLPSPIRDRLPDQLTRRNLNYAALNTFDGQRAAGLSSSAFDIEANNIATGDSRAGLDEVGAAEVQAIMHSHRVK